MTGRGKWQVPAPPSGECRLWQLGIRHGGLRPPYLRTQRREIERIINLRGCSPDQRRSTWLGVSAKRPRTMDQQGKPVTSLLSTGGLRATPHYWTSYCWGEVVLGTRPRGLVPLPKHEGIINASPTYRQPPMDLALRTRVGWESNVTPVQLSRRHTLKRTDGV